MKDERELNLYTNTFIQRQPRYAVKQIGKRGWNTKKKPLPDRPVRAHLNGQYYVGVLGKWYPTFAIIDIDDRDKEVAEEIREALSLDTETSMLLSSESLNSYHLLFRPSYNSKPPTIRLLNEVLKPFAIENNIEIYPQANRPIRLPFGYGQKPLDFEYINLKDWRELLYWFNKLDYFDLKGMPYHQLQLDIDKNIGSGGNLSTYKEGQYLYQNGLQVASSRNEGQFKVLYWLWRSNIPQTTAIEMTYQWIKTKHNGKSKDILSNPRAVKGEIERQAKRIYGTYEYKHIYPDETHNHHKGFITKADIQDIVMLTGASLPAAKFLFNLVKYCYPRRFRTFINLHSKEHLEAWSQRGYLKHLEGLEKLGILQRYDTYQVDRFSKSIKIDWKWKDPGNAILIDDRAPEEFTDTVRASYEPEEFRALLMEAGGKRVTAINTTKRLFEGVTNVGT